ncbi:MAG: hydrolase TatD [Fusobacteriales bacterium]|nr:MAG: hydrolase TatD [Fusobacteriales bacterium]
MKLIDSHAHLDDEKFDEDRDQVLERIQNQMDFVVNIGCDLETSQASFGFAKKYDFIYAVVGMHPMYTEKYNEEIEKKFEDFAKDKKVLAIGEIGLDYHWMTSPKEEQQAVFRKQLDLARKLNKPVVIHTREAMKDTVDILNEYKDITGILHCYPGSVETAKQMIDRFYLGIGGVLTFKNGKKLVEVVDKIPLDRLVIETDCPYMAPTPYRGKRNEPIYTEEVAKKIAEIKNISYEEVVRITNENTRKAYRML